MRPPHTKTVLVVQRTNVHNVLRSENLVGPADEKRIMSSQRRQILTEGEEIAIDVSRYFSPEVREVISCGITPGNLVEFVLAIELEEYEPSKNSDYDLVNTRTHKRVEVKTDLLKQSTFTSTLKPDKFDEVILVDLSRVARTGCIYARLVTKESISCFLTSGGKRLTLANTN